MKKRLVTGILAGIFIVTAIATMGCGKKNTTKEEAKETSPASFTMNAEFSERDLDFSYDEETAVKIALEKDVAQASGDGVEESVQISGGDIKIVKEGTYIVRGTLEEGTIIVDAPDQKVQVVLDNAEISNDDFSCFYVENADKVFLTLAEESKNSFCDGSVYVYTTTERESANAALYAKDDLTINGTGTLEVDGNYENGIICKNDLKIVSAYITVNAEKNGIKGKDSLLIKDAGISVTAGNDGLKADNDTESDKGFVYIESGTFTITAEKDGIQAETGLKICDGDFTITTGGGSVNGEQKDDREQIGYQGKWKEEGYVTETAQTEEAAESDSAKAIKAGVELDILGGNFKIDSKDDGLHSNSLLVIENGNMEIATGDDGIHSDAELQIKAGTIMITKCYEGIESAVIRISGGDIDITASDDGINAAGGELENSQDQKSGMQGNRGGMMETSSGYLYISGGNILIRAEGDGIDTNTDGFMSGGYVVVYGPSNSGNGSLDYGNSFEVTGGTLFTAGSTGMAVAPTSGTTQNTIFATLTENVQAGAAVQITSESGEVLEEFTPTTVFASIIFSDKRLKTGENYNIVVNGENMATITISDTVTSYGNSGGMGGMHGGQNMPDMQNGQNMPGKPDGQGNMEGGQNPPDMQNGQNPPEKPDGQSGTNGGETPPDMPGKTITESL